MAQIIQSTRRLVKVLLDIQQKFYWMFSRAIFLLLYVEKIFTPSSGHLVGSYFSATRHLVENFHQTSSRKSSTKRLVEQKIWPIIDTYLFSILLGVFSIFHIISWVNDDTEYVQFQRFFFPLSLRHYILSKKKYI